jgi:parallel beta-helix repeat protein
LLNNTNNFYFEGDIYPNYWNTTRQTGTRIYSNGTEIGGNYWTNPDGNGYSDTCTDYNHDGFCDDPYQLATNNYDYLPLSNKYSPYYISSCSELNVSGATYYLTQDIIDSSASVCMNISANNVTLDCQGHTIDGVDEGGVYYGIIVSRETEETTNITIKNCVLTDWVSAGISLFYSNSNTLSNITANYNNDGIFLYYSNYNNLSNITANSGSDHGIEIYESNSNTLSNIIANSNSDSGILLDSSSFNNLTNITANSNSYGIYLGWSNSNALSNITANSNTYGIHLDSSNSNTLSNITANSNSGNGIYLYYSNSNTIKNSIIQDNLEFGIYLDSSGTNLIYNNLFNNTNNFYFDGTIYANEWNVTRQEGINIWNTSLGYIGGNYWTNPSGNGFSDTCVDANSDGFCDNNYTLATDNIDYLPIAKIVGYVSPYISITFSYSSINFGILQVNTINPAPNQANGVYNVSIDTNANYQVKAYGSDFTGPSPLPITHLYFDTNTTAENLAYSDAKSLSTTSQVIDGYDKTVTLNYHGYWLSVDKILAGDYNTTVSVVYENV